MTNLTGFVNILKPTGMTSSDVVCKVKKILGTKKVGHFGTLDPAASGVLPLGVGKGTKFFDYFLSKDKEYVAQVEFGVLTDSLDSFGEVLETQDVDVTEEQIKSVLPRFTGKITQVPPKYSAIKINGEKACDLARKGIEFEIKSREIEIFSIDLIKKVSKNRYLFKVHCSAGTYIRTLFADIAEAIGTISTTPVIIRTKSGRFTNETAVTLEALEQNKKLIEIESLFSDFEKIEVTNKELSKKFLCGTKISVNEFNEIKYKKEPFFVSVNGSVVGLYELNGGKVSQIVYLFEN